jgi:hypothetical protein
MDEPRAAMRRAVILALAVLGSAGGAGAHVGSPDVLYEGPAGPYGLLVRIRPPDVVPGTAEVTLRVDRDGVSHATVRPMYFHSGREGAPRADELRAVPGDARLFSGQVWLMEFGSSSVVLTLEGAPGRGEVVVPVPALATSRRLLEPYLGTLLAGLGLTLVFGAVAIMGAASAESTLAPGTAPSSAHKAKGRRVMLLTFAVLVAVLVFGRHWWGQVDGAYLARMYRPGQVSTSIVEGEGHRVLRLELQPPSAEEEAVPGFRAPRFSDEPTTTPLVPDHGKLMHLFLVGEPAMQAFAHLHPLSQDARVFESVLPPLPPGGYRVFADVVHEDGLAETLTGRLDLAERDQPGTAAASAPRSDPDDSWSGAAPTGATQRLEDGSIMTLEGPGLFRAGGLESLRFAVTAPNGSPATLEPYMGMLAHAVVLRDDGSVFVHLHPVGTVPMASQEAFARRAGEALAMDHVAHGADTGVVSFPYAFPRAGRYRLFVQVKREGRVLTGSFDTSVS